MNRLVMMKARALPVGTIKEYGGRKYIKTATGWKFHGTGDKQAVAKVKPIRQEETLQEPIEKKEEKISDKAEELLKSTGIKCLDEKAEEYVDNQIGIFMPKNEQKVPQYIEGAARDCLWDFKRFTERKVSSFVVIQGHLTNWYRNFKDRADMFGTGFDKDFADQFTGHIKNIVELEDKEEEIRDKMGDIHERIDKMHKKEGLDYWAIKNKVKEDEEYKNLDKQHEDLRKELLEEQGKFRDFTKKYRKTQSKSMNEVKVGRRLAALYATFKLNSTLYDKANKAKKDEAPLVTPLEMLSQATTVTVDAKNRLENLIMNKRIGGMSESTQRAIKSKLSRSGEVEKKISLRSVRKNTALKIHDYIRKNFDTSSHGSFGYRIKGIYQIGEADYYDEFKKLEKSKGNIKIGYHGTTFESASQIAKGGFKVGKIKTGRMLGDGVYLTDVSSKSIQYVGDNFGRGVDARGCLFVCKAAMGNVRYGAYDIPNGHDTVFARKGMHWASGRSLVNDEFCVKNPKAILPMYWVDIERAGPGTFEIDKDWLEK